MTEKLDGSGWPEGAIAIDGLTLAEAAHLQAIEGNPLSSDDLAMFEMFEREEWPAEERRAYILRRIGSRKRIAAAE